MNKGGMFFIVAAIKYTHTQTLKKYNEEQEEATLIIFSKWQLLVH